MEGNLFDSWNENEINLRVADDLKKKFKKEKFDSKNR